MFAAATLAILAALALVVSRAILGPTVFDRALAASIAVTSRAEPPKHSPAWFSSSEQGESYFEIGSKRA